MLRGAAEQAALCSSRGSMMDLDRVPSFRFSILADAMARKHQFVLVRPLGVTGAASAYDNCFAFIGGVAIDDTGNIAPDCCYTLGLEGYTVYCILVWLSEFHTWP